MEIPARFRTLRKALLTAPEPGTEPNTLSKICLVLFGLSSLKMFNRSSLTRIILLDDSVLAFLKRLLLKSHDLFIFIVLQYVAIFLTPYLCNN